MKPTNQIEQLTLLKHEYERRQILEAPASAKLAGAIEALDYALTLIETDRQGRGEVNKILCQLTY